MMPLALSRRAQELAERGEPFLTATVVRAQRPTSATAGHTALVLGAGTVEGFVGGECAEHSVRAYALEAIESGEPLLLRILPFGDNREGEEVAREPGAVTVENPCLSGGAIEIFRFERHRADYRMAATAVSLAYFRNIVRARTRRPGV